MTKNTNYIKVPTTGHIILPSWRNYSLTASYETHDLNKKDGIITSRIFHPVKSNEADMAFLAGCDLLGKSIYSNLEVKKIYTSNLIAFNWLMSKNCDSKCNDWDIQRLIKQGISLLQTNDFEGKIQFWKTSLDTPPNIIYGNKKNQLILPTYSFDCPF